MPKHHRKGHSSASAIAESASKTEKMTNAPRGIVSGAVLAILAVAVTAAICFCFYLYRQHTARDQTITDAIKVVRAATEVVSAMAENALPTLRSKIDELEAKGRAVEHYQKRYHPLLERLAAAASETLATVASTSQAGSSATEVDILAARRAARRTV